MAFGHTTVKCLAEKSIATVYLVVSIARCFEFLVKRLSSIAVRKNIEVTLVS